MFIYIYIYLYYGTDPTTPVPTVSHTDGPGFDEFELPFIMPAKKQKIYDSTLNDNEGKYIC
jgi:hypothetical protein